jgi:lipoate-protein ligase A
VEALTCRLLPYASADGPTNMATDEALLVSAQAGQATLRFYGWSEPTLSLGYFQPAAVRLSDPLLANLPFVRRMTGGDTLVHHHELTYALALPPRWVQVATWPQRMHEIIAAALATFGITARLQQGNCGPREPGPLCFRHVTCGDLMIGEHKVVGSAMRKSRGAILQHGGILMAGSPKTPNLPGIKELAGQVLSEASLRVGIVETFGILLRAHFEERCLSPEEGLLMDDVARSKYALGTWNLKR